MQLSSDNRFPRKIAVIGGGTWATALAKLLLANTDRIGWFIHRDDYISAFIESGHNPAYLSDVQFDVSRIDFSNDINEVCGSCGTLVFVVPSPYFKEQADKITVDLSGKNIVSAIKGIVPGENLLITDYMSRYFGVDPMKTLVIAGPCHAEEVAMSRPSYLTIGCKDIDLAATFSQYLSSKNVHTITSSDVEGIEYAAVLKNIYAIAAGVVNGIKLGDNFLAMLVSNAIREMRSFIDAVVPGRRDICDSAYLGDLLVTAYSRFSRNHYLGTMIGKGYSVKAARMSMQQTAEGYFATKCVYEINRHFDVPMPILNAVYDILYRNVRPELAINRMSEYFD